MPAPQELIDIDLTYDYLEELLEDECKCESAHAFADGSPCGPCSVEVEFRAIPSCLGVEPRLWCAERRLQWLSTDRKCEGCKRPSADCWSVIPV